MGLPSTSMNIPIMNGSGKELDLNKIRKALLPVLAEHGFVKEKSRFVQDSGERLCTLALEKIGRTDVEVTIRWRMTVGFGDEFFRPQFVHNLDNMPLWIRFGETTFEDVVEWLSRDFGRRVVPFLDAVPSVEAISAMGRFSRKHLVAL